MLLKFELKKLTSTQTLTAFTPRPQLQTLTSTTSIPSKLITTSAPFPSENACELEGSECVHSPLGCNGGCAGYEGMPMALFHAMLYQNSSYLCNNYVFYVSLKKPLSTVCGLLKSRSSHALAIHIHLLTSQSCILFSHLGAPTSAKPKNEILTFNLQLDYRKIATMYGQGTHHQPSLHPFSHPTPQYLHFLLTFPD